MTDDGTLDWEILEQDAQREECKQLLEQVRDDLAHVVVTQVALAKLSAWLPAPERQAFREFLIAVRQHIDARISDFQRLESQIGGTDAGEATEDVLSDRSD